MLYFVTLTYARPGEDIKAHLATHREWLDEHLRATHIQAFQAALRSTWWP